MSKNMIVSDGIRYTQEEWRIKKLSYVFKIKLSQLIKCDDSFVTIKGKLGLREMVDHKEWFPIGDVWEGRIENDYECWFYFTFGGVGFKLKYPLMYWETETTIYKIND